MAAHRATPSSPGLRIRVLGPFEVAVDGAPLVVDTRKALAILALLAVEHRPYARDELAALLWPDADDESARGALRRTLSVLRAALGGRWLRVDRSSVALEDDGVDVDLRRVEAAMSSRRLEVLAAAAAEARGPFLAGFALRDSPDFDDWRATRASGVERATANVLGRLVTAAEEADDVATAIDAAGRLVALDPLDEAGHRRLMALLARMGDRAGAIRQYRACVAALERELGVAPLAATTDLYEAIRDGRLEPPGGGSARPTAGAPSPTVPAPPTVPARPVAPVAPVASVAAGLPMVGRDAELAAVLEARREATPDGRLVLLTGEAGIGKTRLVEALVEAVAGAGGTALVARCYAAEAGLAYGPIVGLLGAGLGHPRAGERLGRLPVRTLAELERLVDLPGAGSRPSAPGRDDPAGRTRLVEAIADGLAVLVEAGDGGDGGEGSSPGLLAVEDLQWADEASRVALGWLARRLTGRPVLLVLGWRPEDLDEASAAFVASLDALPGVRRVVLRRLDAASVSALVAASAASAASAAGGRTMVDPAALFAESEGLPLFIVEALREPPDNGTAARPDQQGGGRTVRTLIRERLDAVSEIGAQVLAAAAVVGRSFDAGLVRMIGGRTEEETVDALDELVRRGLIREVRDAGAPAYDFVHARFRDTAYDRLSLARRRLLHRRAADALRADSRGRDDSGRLTQVAIHEREAGRDAEAAEAFRQAGLAARTVHALHEAGTHFETALALGHPAAAAIESALGEIRTAEGDYPAAIAALEAAAAVADASQLPGIELRLGRIHARRGDPVTAASHLDAAIDALDAEATAEAVATGRPAGSDGGVQATLARALVERGMVAIGAGDLDLAEASAARALDLAGSDDNPAAGAALRVRGLAARARGDLDGAQAALRRSLELATDDPDPGGAIAAGNALAIVEADAGDHAAAIALLEAALETCRRTGQLHLEAAIENNLADQLHAAGRDEASMAHLKRAVALFADVGGPPGAPSGDLDPEIWKLVTW